MAALAASIAMSFSFASCSSSSVGQANISDTSTAETTAATEASSTETTTSAEKATESTPGAAAVKGNIYDCKGNLLASTAEDGKRRIYADAYAVSFANILTTMSDGYDTAFEDILTVCVDHGDLSVRILFLRENPFPFKLRDGNHSKQDRILGGSILRITQRHPVAESQ